MAISGTGKYVTIEGSHGSIGGGITVGNATATADTGYFRLLIHYKELANNTISLARLRISQPASSLNNRLLLNFPNLTQFYVNGYKGFTGTMRVASDFPWPQTAAQLDNFDGNATYTTYTFKNGLWIS